MNIISVVIVYGASTVTISKLPVWICATFELYKDEFEEHIREQLTPCRCEHCDYLHSSANDIGTIYLMSAGGCAQEDATIINRSTLLKGFLNSSNSFFSENYMKKLHDFM